MNSYRDSDSQSLSFMPFTLTFSFFKVNEKFNLMLIILVFSLPGVASLLQGLTDIVDAQADHGSQSHGRSMMLTGSLAKPIKVPKDGILFGKP